MAWSLSGLYDDRFGLPTVAVVRARSAAIKLRASIALDRTVPWGLRMRRLGAIATGAAAALVLTVSPASAVYQLSQYAGGIDAAGPGDPPLLVELAGAAVPLALDAAVPPIGDAVPLAGDAAAAQGRAPASDPTSNIPLAPPENPAAATGGSAGAADAIDAIGASLPEARSGRVGAAKVHIAGTFATTDGDFAFMGGAGIGVKGLAAPMKKLAGYERGAPVADSSDGEGPLLAIRAAITQLPTTESAGSYSWPANGTLFSRFGSRDAELGSTYHKGIDISGDSGDPIYAADGGEVIVSERSGSFGYMIQIRHDNGQVTLYAHSSELLVGVGDRVAQGQQIALMGRTGLASGVHLHFEILIGGENVDPLKYLES